MATEFKRFTMADVPTTALPNEDNGNSDIYSVPANCDSVIIGMILCNKSSGAIVVDALIEAHTGEDVYLIKNADVPYGSSLEIISGKVVVSNTGSGTGDVVQARCATADALDVTLSVLENT